MDDRVLRDHERPYNMAKLRGKLGKAMEGDWTLGVGMRLSHDVCVIDLLSGIEVKALEMLNR